MEKYKEWLEDKVIIKIIIIIIEKVIIIIDKNKEICRLLASNNPNLQWINNKYFKSSTKNNKNLFVHFQKIIKDQQANKFLKVVKLKIKK